MDCLEINEEKETIIIFHYLEKESIKMVIRPLYKCFRVWISDSKAWLNKEEELEGFILSRGEILEAYQEYSATATAIKIQRE